MAFANFCCILLEESILGPTRRMCSSFVYNMDQVAYKCLYATCMDSLSFINSYELGVFLWDIGKQHSPRCDATERGVPSGAILFAKRNFIKK